MKKGGHYSREDIIKGRTLFKEIRYINEIFVGSVHNFGKSDNDIILWKNTYFLQMQRKIQFLYNIMYLF